MDLHAYKLFTRAHRRVLEQLKTDVRFFLEDMGRPPVALMESRIKTFASAAGAAERRKVSIEELGDVAGLRVVVGSRPDVEVILSFLRDKKARGEAEIHRDRPTKNRGYRAHHVVMTPKLLYSPVEPKIEVQVATVAEYAFNFLSRSWLYKKGAPSPTWEPDFRRVATRLREVDDQLARLQPLVVASNLRDDNAALGACECSAAFRERYGSELPLDEAVFIVRHLAGRGYATCRDLHRFFDENHDDWELLGALAQDGNDKAELALVLFWGQAAQGNGRLFVELVLSLGKSANGP